MPRRPRQDPTDGRPLYERIREDIIGGAFPPGSPLVEATLASRYGVSRTPVREALRHLEHDGLVERRERSASVRRPGAEEIHEIYEVRCVLERSAARTAAERHTALDAVRLQALLDEMEALDDGNVAGRVRLNGEFHKALWRASNNRVLLDVLVRLYANMKSLPFTTLDADERWQASVREHRALVEAIVGGDADAAERLMVEHLRSGRDLRLRRAIAGER